MSKFNAGQSFADGDTVTGAKLNNIAGLLDIYTGLISEQTAMVATVSTADQLLIADVDNGDSGAANRVTVQKLLNDGLTNGTFSNLNLTGNLNVTQLSTLGTINNTRGTVGILNSTTGTIQSLTSSTANISQGSAIFTQGTIATLNSTTGTIGTLVATGTITGSTNVVNIGSGQIYKDASGNVGIGTASPTGNLDIYSATSASPIIRGDSTTRLTIFRASTDSSRATLALTKSRGNQASPSAVASGDNIGGVAFNAYGGTTSREIASIVGFVDTYTSDTNISSLLTFNTTPAGGVVNTERMRIDSSGNVGIGVASPNDILDIQTPASSYAARIRASASNFALVRFVNNANNNTDAIIGTPAANNLALYTNGFIERLRIDSSGNVGIAVTGPVNKLEIVGSFGRGAPVTKTTDFTLAATENWIIVNKATTCIATLPAASSWTGREFTIKTLQAVTVVSPTSNISPLNSATPGTAILPATAGAWATLVSDGTNWVKMAASA
jgi:hypothetical protein